MLGKVQKIPRKFISFCEEDLKTFSISGPTFEWNKKQNSQWDNTIIAVILKHWCFAKSQGAFSKQALNPQFSEYKILLAVLEHWLHGQKENYGKEKLNPNYKVKV